MYVNAGYLNQSEGDLENLNVPLQVNGCGVYRLEHRPVIATTRPFGRSDYQLIYISSGRVWFTFDGNLTEVTAGNMVLYRPRMRQQYVYYLEDSTEVYWVHFTGHESDKLAGESGFLQNQILSTGISAGYQELFLGMIQELQIRRPCFEEILPLLLRELLLLVRRHMAEGSGEKRRIQREMEHAVHYFNENYFRDIEIEEYAKAQHMSTSWFIRSFRDYMGTPPLKYITSIRINRAKELLESTDYTVSEIGTIVGYENPLYFSRLFKKQAGISPKEYRKSSIAAEMHTSMVESKRK